MAFNSKINLPIQEVVLANAAGNLTATMSNSPFVMINGNVEGAVPAGDMPALTGFSIAGNASTIFTFFTRYDTAL